MRSVAPNGLRGLGSFGERPSFRISSSRSLITVNRQQSPGPKPLSHPAVRPPSGLPQRNRKACRETKNPICEKRPCRSAVQDAAVGVKLSQTHPCGFRKMSRLTRRSKYKLSGHPLVGCGGCRWPRSKLKPRLQVVQQRPRSMGQKAHSFLARPICEEPQTNW